MRVAVLGGGRSSEHDVSLASAASVRDGLDRAGHEALAVEIGRDGRWVCDGNAVAIEPGTGLLGADVVFPALHGPFGEDGTVQGLLEIADVPYVGAGVLTSAVCMDKVTFKHLMARAGLPQVEHVGLRHGDSAAEVVDRLGLPLFVKPARLGSSVGISKVSAESELADALAAAFDHDPVVIAERMSPGMEVECAVIGNARPEVSQPGEIVARSEWYDHDAKYREGGMELVVPARLEPDALERVREVAAEVYRAVRCAGFARIDFFVEEGERVLVNELNTIPGFTATSVFPKLFEASGVNYPDLLDRLVALAVERHRQERSYRY